jgi:hypothetical protein
VFCPIALAALLAFLTHTSAPPTARAQGSHPCGQTQASAASPSTTSRQSGETKPKALDHDDRWRHLDGLWTHREAKARARVDARTAVSETVEVRQGDVGAIAVLEDAGDLMTRSNPLDLADAGLRFSPNESGSYDVRHVSYGFRQPLGSAVTLADDDAREVELAFAFRYFNQSYTRAFINSDGNVTFGSADTASTDRSISRWLSGAPRIAAFFADLDPSLGGSVMTASADSAFTVTWCGVQEYGSPRSATVQLVLLADGTIEVHMSAHTTSKTAIVGISPGATSEFTVADFSQGTALSSSSGAIGERFTTDSNIDTVATTRRFLATHPDEFDNIVIFTDTPLVADAFAYQLSISNSIQGLNLGQFDSSAAYGTSGKLQSLLYMDTLGKYPDDPLEKFLGANSTVSVLGQEFGHRWLAFFEFRDHTSRRSRALLGRDASHWSFFFDSDGSVMEGNDIVEVAPGSFRTAAAVERFSLLDQYAMGLIDSSQVPPFWYVESPTNVSPQRTSSSAPQTNVTFTGTRREVRIDDVIAVAGPRVPSAAETPRVYRQAFVYVVTSGRQIDPAEIAKLDRIRMAWDVFVSAATDSRLRVETGLALAAESGAGVQSRANKGP